MPQSVCSDGRYTSYTNHHMFFTQLGVVVRGSCGRWVGYSLTMYTRIKGNTGLTAICR